MSATGGITRGEAFVIDDDPKIAPLVTRLLLAEGIATRALDSAMDGLEQLRHGATPDFILVDVQMPGMTGLEFLEQAALVVPDVPVVVMTGSGSVEIAVEAMKKGAFDFLTKPFERNDVVRAVCARALAHKRLLRQNQQLRTQVRGLPQAGIVGTTPSMRKLRQAIEAVAPTDATVLVVGETGTGKEVVSRAIHTQSLRNSGPFVPVNCSAMSEQLLESELFGHVRGAFSGATTARRGLCEAASGGTLFLDEVAELSLATQARLLRVLQEGEIRPVGTDLQRHVDVRIVAATQHDLAQAVRDGTFRQDFYYRLNVFRVVVPPLRDRLADIPALTQHFVERISGSLGRTPPLIEPEALKWLAQRAWDGNLRQLENELERAIILCKDRLGEELLDSLADLESGRDSEASPVSLAPASYRDARSWFEKQYLQELLRNADGSLAEAARRASLDPSNLRRLLKRHGLD